MIPLNTSATQACRRPCPSRLRRLAPLLLAATAAFLSLFSPIHGIAGEEGRLPNVVLVMTDDQGYGDLSCLGNPVLKTPNLDKLYAESVRLTDYHVAPTCSPTRAALLTGRWSNRTGVWHTIMGRSMLRENEVTMGQIFQDAGYATGMFGKWHLGDNYPYRPEDRGFAEVIRHGAGGVGQTPDYWDNAYFDGSYFYNGRSSRSRDSARTSGSTMPSDTSWPRSRRANRFSPTSARTRRTGRCMRPNRPASRTNTWASMWRISSG
jgi:arylsulfatase A-like enzyme